MNKEKSKANKEWNQAESRQISVQKTSEALIELNSFLLPADKSRYWRIHADHSDGDEWTSRIRIVMVGYKKGYDFVSVYANVRPEDIKYLYSRVWNGVSEFRFNQQKIFQEDKDSTNGIVTKLDIQRHIKNSRGEVLNNPWSIQIENGTGIVEKKENGGQTCQRGSYTCRDMVSIRLKDADFFALLARGTAAIEAFEHDQMTRRRNAGNFQKLYQRIERLIQKQEGKYAA